MYIFVIEDHMLDWHSCQICYPLEIKLKKQSKQSLNSLAAVVTMKACGTCVCISCL